MSASRNFSFRRHTSPAGLPAPEGVAPSSVSGAGLFDSNHVDQLGPQLADVPAPKEVSSAFGAGVLSVLTADLDLTDIPADFERVAENRFASRAAGAPAGRATRRDARSGLRPLAEGTTHNRESSMGRPGVPLGARPQPPP